MRKIILLVFSMLFAAILFTGCAKSQSQASAMPSPAPVESIEPVETPAADVPLTAPKFDVSNAAGSADGLKDGTYTAESTLTKDGFYSGTVAIKDGRFISMEFVKYDEASQKVDIAKYIYTKGVEAFYAYPEQFIQIQDAANVDAITGATSTYEGFIEVLIKIRKQATKLE